MEVDAHQESPQNTKQRVQMPPVSIQHRDIPRAMHVMCVVPWNTTFIVQDDYSWLFQTPDSKFVKHSYHSKVCAYQQSWSHWGTFCCVLDSAQESCNIKIHPQLVPLDIGAGSTWRSQQIKASVWPYHPNTVDCTNTVNVYCQRQT